MLKSAAKWMLRAVLCLLMFFSFSTAFAGIVNFFVVAPVVFYAACFAYSFLPHEFKQKLKSNKAAAVLLRIFSVCIALGIAVAAVCGGFMVAAACNTPSGSESTVIVLGCQVHGDGTPSAMLQGRINAAYGYLAGHPDAVCVAAGGQGSGENESEGSAIKKQLVAMGIDAERIYAEEMSQNTYQNITFAKEIIDRNGLSPDAVIASDGFHQLRAQTIARNAGCNASAASSATPWYLAEAMILREMVANVKCVVFGY